MDDKMWQIAIAIIIGLLLIIFGRALMEIGTAVFLVAIIIYGLIARWN